MPESVVLITPEQFLDYWQGHRRLTRKMIEAFPEEQLFSFSLGSLRSFGQLGLEMLAMGSPTVAGIVTNEWNYDPGEATTKQGLLSRWDEATAEIDRLFPRIPIERYQETMTAFGQYTMPVWSLLLYIVDNEVHHRGQGYVYLRALGIEPPQFFDRD